MNNNLLSPYIRIAMFSTLTAPFIIRERVIYDYELIFVNGGKCKLTVNGIPYICFKNDVILLPPGIPHIIESIDNTDFIQPHIHFDLIYNSNSEITPISFKNICNMTEFECSLVQNNLLADKKLPFIFTPDDINNFQKKMFELIQIYSSKRAGFELLCKARLLDLLYDIFNQFENPGYTNTQQNHKHISVIKDYIDNNFTQIITLDSLSKQFHINKFTLLRLFKACYSQGIISYYRNKRAEFAKTLLKTTKLSIASIGSQLSFTDVYSFSRFFKTYAGCSPKEYRKNGL